MHCDSQHYWPAHYNFFLRKKMYRIPKHLCDFYLMENCNVSWDNIGYINVLQNVDLNTPMLRMRHMNNVFDQQKNINRLYKYETDQMAFGDNAFRQFQLLISPRWTAPPLSSLSCCVTSNVLICFHQALPVRSIRSSATRLFPSPSPRRRTDTSSSLTTTVGKWFTPWWLTWTLSQA